MANDPKHPPVFSVERIRQQHFTHLSLKFCQRFKPYGLRLSFQLYFAALLKGILPIKDHAYVMFHIGASHSTCVTHSCGILPLGLVFGQKVVDISYHKPISFLSFSKKNSLKTCFSKICGVCPVFPKITFHSMRMSKSLKTIRIYEL